MIRARNITTQLPLTYGFEDWCYWSGGKGQFLPLPHWATFFMVLGKALAEIPATGHKTLTALSVPTARFAAPLSLAGYLLGSDEVVPLEDHIGILSELELGRPVWVNKATKRIKGNFDGIVQIASGEGVRVSFKSGKTCWTETFPLASARQVQLASKDKPTRQSRFIHQVPLGRFAAEALKSAENPRAWKQAKLEAVIIGQKSRLGSEIAEVPFSLFRDGLHTHGFLQEIVRTVDFVEAQDSHGFASAIETPNAAITLDEAPGLAIFDGPRSFLKAHRRHHAARHWIVVLDRTSRGFFDGVAAVDDFFLQRTETNGSASIPAPPTGIEMTTFGRGS